MGGKDETVLSCIASGDGYFRSPELARNPRAGMVTPRGTLVTQSGFKTLGYVRHVPLELVNAGYHSKKEAHGLGDFFRTQAHLARDNAAGLGNIKCHVLSG